MGVRLAGADPWCWHAVQARARITTDIGRAPGLCTAQIQPRCPVPHNLPCTWRHRTTRPPFSSPLANFLGEPLHPPRAGSTAASRSPGTIPQPSFSTSTTTSTLKLMRRPALRLGRRAGYPRTMTSAATTTQTAAARGSTRNGSKAMRSARTCHSWVMPTTASRMGRAASTSASTATVRPQP